MHSVCHAVRVGVAPIVGWNGRQAQRRGLLHNAAPAATPGSRYTLPDGTQRLEYATGPYGRATWMMDLGPQGPAPGDRPVLRLRQVLADTELMVVQAAMPMAAARLVQWIGRPGETRHGGRAGGQVWGWRYQTNDCLWFLISVDDAGTAQNATFMTDPRCDTPSDARN